MIQLISNKELANIVDDINVEWGIKASLKDAPITQILPDTNSPQEGVVYFPKRTSFYLLLFQIIKKGWENKNQLFYGNQLINLNEMIVAALNIKDTDSADILIQAYCEKLKNFAPLVLFFKNYDYNITNTLLFFLYHELTHVRIAQQPSFFETKKDELSQMINRAQPSIKKSMMKYLNKIEKLEEEVICDLEACKKLREGLKSRSESVNSYLDIINTINFINCISNNRDNYIRSNRCTILAYWDQTQSKQTKKAVARCVFINHFWKDGLSLSNKEIFKMVLSNISLSLSQEAKDFCKAEFKKSEDGFFNPDRRRAKEIEEEIYEAEQSFIKSLMTPSDSL